MKTCIQAYPFNFRHDHGIGNVLTIPSQQIIQLIDCGQGNMQGILCGFFREMCSCMDLFCQSYGSLINDQDRDTSDACNPFGCINFCTRTYFPDYTFRNK